MSDPRTGSSLSARGFVSPYWRDLWPTAFMYGFPPRAQAAHAYYLGWWR